MTAPASGGSGLPLVGRDQRPAKKALCGDPVGPSEAGSGPFQALCALHVEHAEAGEPGASLENWRIVLHHERNVVMYNPHVQPPLRSRVLPPAEEMGANLELAQATGRCPVCNQTLNSRQAFAAQAYFDILHNLSRQTVFMTPVEAPNDVDVLAESDLYRILGVRRSSRLDDIKRAYRKCSLRFHPDKNRHDLDAKLKFQKVAEAFSVLSDDTKRSKYDHSGYMDLDDFDVEQFMKTAQASRIGQPRTSDVETEDAEVLREFRKDGGASNPFLVPPAPVPVPVFSSEGGCESEAEAAAALRHLPRALLNTGYYARFFSETRKLGSGSFGTVFLCKHVLDDLQLGVYAVKKVPVGDNKEWLTDMIKEVKTFERLRHPNIVEYKHSWMELSRSSAFCPFVPFLFILMQYCNGGSLDELIWLSGNPMTPRDPALSVIEVWNFLLDIVLGLRHLHRQGIIHRDLKPTNILMQYPEVSHQGSRRGMPMALLSDFGTAAAFGEIPVSVASSRGYTGTLEYTAPELLQGGQRIYTETSDMWSLGIVLYAMCFSSLPFQHENPKVLKRLIRDFAEEHRKVARSSAVADSGGPQTAGQAGMAARSGEVRSSSWTCPLAEDTPSWLLVSPEHRVGKLRMVLAALLALDPFRRPTAVQLLENPLFRQEASFYGERQLDLLGLMR